MPLEDSLAAFADAEEAISDTQSTPSYTPHATNSSLDSSLSSWADADEKDSLQASSSIGLQKDTSKSTKILQLFGRTGLPKEFIERNQDFVEQESIKKDFDPDRLMKESPAFAGWLAEHPDHVAAAKNDVSKLSYIERQIRFIGGSKDAGQLMDELVDLGGKAFNDQITPQERKRQAELEQKLSEIGRANEGLDLDFFSEIPGAVVEQFPNLVRGLKGKIEYSAKGLAAGTAAGAIVGSPGGPPGTAAGAIGGGVAGGLAGWRWGAAVSAGEVERNAAYIDYEKLKDEQGNPLDKTTIKGLSLMAGAVNGAVEGLTGVEALIDKLPGVKQLTRKGVKELLKTPTARGAILEMAKDVGSVMATEGATEAFQMYVTKTGGELAKWAKDGGSPVEVLGRIFSKENFEQAKQEAIKGAQAGGGTAAVLTTPNLVQDLRQVKQANETKKAFEAVGKVAESAEFAKNLPDSLKSIIERSVSDGPIESLYVPSDTFNTYFQGKGVDPRDVYEEITGNPEAYDQAIQTGQPLPIKTADYASKLAGTEHNAFFANELKTDLDAMNAREAAEWMEQQDKILEAQTAQDGVQVQSATDPLVKIQNDISEQLRAAGYNPDAIGPFAEYFAQRYQARAARRGMGEDPAELFKAQNLTIQRELPDVLRKINSKTSELDALLNRLRTGDAPRAQDIYGPSLADFLREKGGVQDQGGELKALDVDGSRKAFQKKLTRKDGLTLDDAAELAAEAGYLEDRNITALLDALDKDTRGTPVYAQGRENAALLDVQMNLDAMKDFLKARSIDLATTTNEQIKAIFTQAAQQSLPMEGQTFEQGGTIEVDGQAVRKKSDGVIINNLDDAAGLSNRDASHFVVFDSAQVKSATGNRGTFDPNKANILYQGDDTPKGSITFGDQQSLIKLFNGADLSTVLHESGHLWLNELIDDATTAGTADTLKTDLDTILKWMGLDVTSAAGKDAIKAAIQTKHHEQFARGFEAYAMEGKSPSTALREVFAKFRNWLIQVYRTLTTKPLQVKLNDDVRAVMDRMVATDDQIDQAAAEADVLPMFTDAESAGMTPKQFDAYKETVANASTTARETLQAKLMKQLAREKEEWWKTERAAMEQTVTAEVHDQNEYIALAVLQTGKMPDGSDIPNGIEVMKLNRKAMEDIFGKDFIKTLPKGMTDKDGMHPDVAAPIFGYQTGQELVMAVANARPKDKLIQAETDRRMREAHGDLLTDGTIAEEAKAAVLNELQEKVVHAELKALNAKRRDVAKFVKAAQDETKAAAKAGRDLLATMTPTLEQVRETARKIIARTALKNVNANQYSITARQASRKSTAAAAKDDWVNAGHFKQQELLNLALFRDALILQEQIEKTKDLAKKFHKTDEKLAKSRNVDLVNVGRAILSQYGLGPETDKTAAQYLEAIQTYDEDLYKQWKSVVDEIAPRPLPYTALTVDEFVRLASDLDSLWTLSRRVQQTKIDGKMVDRADIIDQLNARLDTLTPQEKKRVLGDLSASEDAKVGLMSWVSALRRVESWVDAMDGGDHGGVFRRYIWNPISDAAVTFRSEKATVMQRYMELMKPIDKTMTHEMIPAPELGQGYQFRGKPALLHAILHTGNASNLDKLIRGYGWTADQWTAFVERAQRDGTLTKADYDYAQGVWDLLDSIKPDAQRAHHDMYGYYFNEITASPIQTQWGEYKGGYVPAIADAAKSVDQAIRQEKDLFDQAGNSFMFPTTGRGFTKGRVEKYAAPLALNLRTIPIHLDKVMRFVHLEPRVKDAARLVTNKAFRNALDAYDATAAKDMLVPWLQRAAQQTVSTPGKNRHADRLFRYLRNSVGSQIMVANVVNTLQQFTGFSLSLTKVKAKHLRHGLFRYLSGPGSMADDIHAKSKFMAQRTTTQVMEIQATIDDITLNPTKYEKAVNFSKRHGYFMQQGTQNIVDLITWAGAYDQAVKQGETEQDAVRQADSAVRETQGSFDPESISAFEAGTPFTRAFTMFYSYFNMQANLLGTEFQKVARDMGVRKGAGRAFYLYFVGFMIPAVLAEIIVKASGGFDADDEDEYLNEALSVYFMSQIRTSFAMVPGVGPMALAGVNMLNNKWYDDRIATSPVVSMLESAVRAPISVYEAMAEEKHSKRAVKDFLTLLGLTTGLPASALGRPLGYVADVYDGVAKPEDALDVGRGLLSGKDVNRKQ